MPLVRKTRKRGSLETLADGLSSVFFFTPLSYIHVQKLPGFKVNFSLFLTVNCKKWSYLLARITTNKHTYSWKNNQLALLFKMGTFEGNMLIQFHIFFCVGSQTQCRATVQYSNAAVMIFSESKKCSIV